MKIVVKVGTSSLTDASGTIDPTVIERIAHDVRTLRDEGHEIVIVSSGAIAAGLPALGFTERPTDQVTLQAASSVGQPMLYQLWEQLLRERAITSSQILLAHHNFGERSQYLHARDTLLRLIELKAVPVINENDAVTDDEIRYGDNDRIAALVAHLVGAEVLVLLTDTDGVLTSDPRIDPDASLISEVAAFDASLLEVASSGGSTRGSGGMASKVLAARIAAWSGVRTVIARADRPNVVSEAAQGVEGVGTTVLPSSARISARKLWIAFALETEAKVHIDAGAALALRKGGVSLLAAGVDSVSGSFERRDAVEVIDPNGDTVAKGLARLASSGLKELATGVVLHVDDMVILAEPFAEVV